MFGSDRIDSLTECHEPLVEDTREQFVSAAQESDSAIIRWIMFAAGLVEKRNDTATPVTWHLNSAPNDTE